MKFSIVTPSFRQLDWLKRCVRSVEDQQGVEVEHIVQDAGTGPELDAWVRSRPRAQLFVEKDRGMYDAINRGFERSSGGICAYLNCDEQYLPGTLARVWRAFAENPGVDFFVGDCLVVDASQDLIAFRRATPLRRAMIETDHLYANSCTLFFRRRLLEEGLRFDPSYAAMGDHVWVCEALSRRFRPGLISEYLSTFTWTGENLGAGSKAAAEASTAFSRLSPALRLAAPLLRRLRHVEKMLRGGYSSGPIEYQVFRGADDETRSAIRCEKPTYRYPGA